MWPFAPDDIARELKRRKIEWLLHSTHVAINLPQIFSDGYIDTARGLRARLGDKAERLLHDPRRLEKFSIGLDYINCSLTVPNFELLYARSGSAWQAEWIHFRLELNLLENSDTLFCLVSAAQDYGQHVTNGLTGLRSMFADRVDTYDRAKLSKSDPTHPQAEVLVKGPLQLSTVTEILVSDGRTAQEVERLAEFYKRDTKVRIEPKLFIWPKRLKK